MVLGFGEMRKKDRPGEDTWQDDKALNEHFTYLDEKYSTDDDNDDDGPPTRGEAWFEGKQTMENQLVKQLEERMRGDGRAAG